MMIPTYFVPMFHSVLIEINFVNEIMGIFPYFSFILNGKHFCFYTEWAKSRNTDHTILNCMLYTIYRIPTFDPLCICIYILIFLINQTTKNNKEYTVDIYLLKQDIQ